MRGLWLLNWGLREGRMFLESNAWNSTKKLIGCLALSWNHQSAGVGLDRFQPDAGAGADADFFSLETRTRVGNTGTTHTNSKIEYTN
jgi:hypothetical protein